ncbi:MAG: UDP-N-acetylmuramoyl-tripeptide--D-alanyl-D-alanine ligase [Vicingaceae bacterium]
MKNISIQELYKIYREHPVISKDSRKVENSCLYFALKGDKFDGNQFAKKALEKGAAYAIIDDESYAENEKYLIVEDSLIALQNLARYHRSQLNIPIIGITGSNGKTTTKELIQEVLKTKYNCFATAGNYNNHIGVPLSVLSITKDHEIAVIEMGANHQGEIDFLCSIAQPNYGLITNIGKAHLEGFGGIEGIKKGKSELYRYIQKQEGKVFINGDDAVLTELAKGIEQITFGRNENNDCRGEILNTQPNIIFKWSQNNQSEIAETQLYGSYNFYNMLAASCIGAYFKVPTKNIKAALESYQSQNNRSQFIHKEDCEIYLDAYNANPSSMKLALENFKSNNHHNQIVILGDMFELGEASRKEHQSILDLIKSLDFQTVCLVGNHFYAEKDSYPEFNFFKSTEDAKKWFDQKDISNAQILFKGSRGMAMERMIE